MDPRVLRALERAGHDVSPNGRIQDHYQNRHSILGLHVVGPNGPERNLAYIVPLISFLTEHQMEDRCIHSVIVCRDRESLIALYSQINPICQYLGIVINTISPGSDRTTLFRRFNNSFIQLQVVLCTPSGIDSLLELDEDMRIMQSLFSNLCALVIDNAADYCTTNPTPDVVLDRHFIRNLDEYLRGETPTSVEMALITTTEKECEGEFGFVDGYGVFETYFGLWATVICRLGFGAGAHVQT